jgi:pimeloyl-ACP methyl ester carboxylesterase
VSPATDVVVPDLRGFGESDKHPADPAGQHDADAQARSVVGLIDELGLDRPVIGGYDIGSRIAQTVARGRSDLATSPTISSTAAWRLCVSICTISAHPWVIFSRSGPSGAGWRRTWCWVASWPRSFSCGGRLSRSPAG